MHAHSCYTATVLLVTQTQLHFSNTIMILLFWSFMFFPYMWKYIEPHIVYSSCRDNLIRQCSILKVHVNDFISSLIGSSPIVSYNHRGLKYIWSSVRKLLHTTDCQNSKAFHACRLDLSLSKLSFTTSHNYCFFSSSANSCGCNNIYWARVHSLFVFIYAQPFPIIRFTVLKTFAI